MRIVDVKSVLANSFMELCREKPVDKITIQDIVRNCNSGRQTFYNHFDNKYELIKWIYEREVKAATDIFEQQNESWYNCILKAYTIFSENIQFFMSVVKLPEFVDFFYHNTMDYFIFSIRNRFGESALTEDLLYTIRFATCGVVYFSLQWIENGAPESPEFMARHNVDNLPLSLRNFF